jgi:hypothetical protein
MPHYDFFCHACRSPFSKALTPADYEEGNVVCPIAAAKKWNTVFRLSALSQQKRVHEKDFRRVRVPTLVRITVDSSAPRSPRCR